MARWVRLNAFLAGFTAAALVWMPSNAAQLQRRGEKSNAQASQEAQPGSQGQEQEPPEEDPDLKPKEYAFNPLEATRNITAGNFYFKKGNYRAAARRYEEATKWDPTSAEALLKLGEASEKLHDWTEARAAFTKYLALDPPPKDSEAVKKRLAKLPNPDAKKR